MRAGHAIPGAVVGALFVGHGAQKLFGVFGGPGLEGTGQFFEQGLGLKPGKVHAALAGGAELGGGALLATGIAPPAAATALQGTMATAIWTVHKEKGLWNAEGGYEYPLVLMSVVFGVTMRRSGLAWALASLAAGIGGTAALLTFGRQAGEEQQRPEAASQDGQPDAEVANATA